MDPERWSQVEALFQASLHYRDPDARDLFLAEACKDDESLRRDVEVLLAQHDSRPPAIIAADLKPGAQLGPYRIDGILGKGGMGEVYEARDQRLNRSVAIKISAERFSSRFEREALAVAALNHPNICTLYDVGPNYLVMELVEGPDLADRIQEGALTVYEAIAIARQISDALESAHVKGIVHRDLKPANIKIRPDGKVKVLDFGLATQPNDSDAAKPTVTITAPGTVVGTAAYMSPEQARGKPVDQRTDVWAFGVVLYEMLSGQRPFRGETTTDVLAAIVNREPDWSLVPEKTRKLLRSCLEKDPEQRLRHIGDFALLLEEPAPAAPARRGIFLWIAALLALAAAGGWMLWRTRSAPPAGTVRTVKFTFTPQRLRRGSERDIDAEVSVSQDGRHVGYVEAAGGQLWVRDLDQEQARPVPGATNVYEAFWSPDDRFIAYARGLDLVRVPSQGGTPEVVCKLAHRLRGASWGPGNDTIVFGDGTGLLTVPGTGGQPTRILSHEHLEQPTYLDLPGGRHAFLFQVLEPGIQGHQIQYLIAGEQTRHTITVSNSTNPYPVYSPTGHILYSDGQGGAMAIWALPFSLSAMKATGKAFPIAQLGSSPKVSRSGTLVYSDVPSNQMQLTWVDRTGKELSSIGQPQLYVFPALSPDGRKLTVKIGESGFDLWTCDVDRGVMSRLTFESSAGMFTWSPKGDEITYFAFRNGVYTIQSRAANGTGDPKTLAVTPEGLGALDWSPDQRFLVYEARTRETKNDLLFREMQKDGTLGEPKVFLKTPSDEGAAKFSPDGRFVAYVSDESGRPEVYVQTFPPGGGKWRISANGGMAPLWRRDGKELFYVEGRKLMAAGVGLKPVFSQQTPAVLFESELLVLTVPNYDASPDGKRFLVRVKLPEKPLAIHVVDNWFEEFRAAQKQ